VDQATHNKIVSFIWSIAADVLRDLFKRGKYPDVILPMCVIRRMDAVLEPTKQNVRETLGDTLFEDHFYKPQPLRTLEAISADILAIEKEAEGLLDGLLKAGAKP